MTTNPAVRLGVTTALLGASDEASKTRYPFCKGAHDARPTVRLGLGDRSFERDTLSTPNVRLSVVIEGGGANSPDGIARHFNEDDRSPALLVSYVYVQPFLRHKHRYHYRDWVMDSGAFSAHMSGTKIELQAYIDKCRALLETDPSLTEVFALDVIGDWRASLKNTEEMWRQGIGAIPCYHLGEPQDVLTGIARDYPKIAVGGVVGYKHKDKWAEQIFARVWPCKIHGFGFGS
jgi:hypothetical protein